MIAARFYRCRVGYPGLTTLQPHIFVLMDGSGVWLIRWFGVGILGVMDVAVCWVGMHLVC